MNPICKPVKSREEYYIEFTDDELKTLKMEKGQKYTCKIEDGALKLIPFVKMELDISNWEREILEFLIQESCERDVSVNEIINEVVEKAIKNV